MSKREWASDDGRATWLLVPVSDPPEARGGGGACGGGAGGACGALFLVESQCVHYQVLVRESGPKLLELLVNALL